jgi:hypothetical protein
MPHGRSLLRHALLLMVRKPTVVHRHKEVPIRTFGVGLLAIAALAMAGLLLSRRRRPAVASATSRRNRQVDDIYAAGW